jgi:Cu+-exporting ATPase
MIFNSLPDSKLSDPDYFSEKPGKGIEAGMNGINIKLGKSELVYNDDYSPASDNDNLKAESKTYISINGKVYGYFILQSCFRPNLKEMFFSLRKKFRLILLSGDNSAEKNEIINIAPEDMEMYFDYLPQQKLDKVIEMQSRGNKVMMIGDGLNDSAALSRSDVGIAIAQNTSNFTPGSDAILLSDDLVHLPKFIEFSRKGRITVYLSFGISFLYNIIGLSFAVQGLLTPVLSAILMPVSSISIVLFTVLRTRIGGKLAELK